MAVDQERTAFSGKIKSKVTLQQKGERDAASHRENVRRNKCNLYIYF